MPRFQIYAIVLTTITVAWAALVVLSPNPGAQMKRISEDFASIPLQTDGWYGTDLRFDNEATTLKILNTCQLLQRSYYRDSTNSTAQLSIVLGLDLGDFHQPEVCMGGGGWRVVNSRIITVKPNGAPQHQATLNHMRSEQYGDIILVYWFYMAGEVTPTLGSKLSQAFRNAFREPEPSAMVKFTAPVEYDDRTSAEEAATGLCVSLEKYILQVVKKKPNYEGSEMAIKRLEAE